MAKISQTSAFTLCEDSSCDDPKEGVAEKIECKQGCYCQLFQRKKKSDDPWDVTPTDGAHEAKKKDDFEYTCLCVKPILPSGYTLCNTPLCKLTDSQDAGGAAQVECTGDCAAGCNCTLFRLHTKPKNPDKKAAAKWEFVAQSGSKQQREGGYYYRCFCAK